MIGLAAIVYINMTKSAGTTTATPERKMIVVLPFENLGSPDDDYFAEGVRDEISNKLSSLSSLGVISRNSAEQCAKSNKSTKEIGKELGVDYILTGSIRWAKSKDKESRIRIIPQLVRVSDDVSIWSESFNKVINDIFDVQNEIAQNVVDQLGIKMLPGQSVKAPPPTRNLEAYDYYTKAYKFQYVNSTHSDLLTCIRLYEKAIELDPNFAEAYAQMSIAYNAVYYWYNRKDKNNLVIASKYLQKAKELKPNLALVHLANGFYYMWIKDDGQLAEDEFKKTIEVQPSNAEAHYWVGGFLWGKGEYQKGMEYFLKASALDPLVRRYTSSIGDFYFALRDYKKSEKYLKKTIEMDPSMSSDYIPLAKTYLAWKGDINLAEKALSNIKDDSYLDDSENFFIYLTILKRNYDKALNQLKVSKREYSDYYWGFIPNSQMIALVYKYKKEPELSNAYFDTSRIQLVKMIKKDPKDKRFRLALSISYSGLGNKERALNEYSRYRGVKIEDITKNNYKDLWGNLLKIYILLGDYDNALEQIDAMLSKPTHFSVNILKLDPLYDPLRNLSGYKKIIDKYSVEKTD
jgi:TolB-like protein/Tfp pilus assembly protein PilF